MEQQNSRMVAEVNKLIANALIKEGGVFLPNLGSLSVKSVAPQPSKGAGIAGPSREILYTKEEKHRPLIVVIAEYGNCTPQQAAQIYDKWFEAVSRGGNARIDAIGTIFNGEFTIAPEMLARLNPVARGPKPIVAGVKRNIKEKVASTSTNHIVYAVCSIIAIGAIASYFIFFGGCDNIQSSQEVVVQLSVEEQAEQDRIQAEQFAAEQERIRQENERLVAEQEAAQRAQELQAQRAAQASRSGIRSSQKMDNLFTDRAKNERPDVARQVAIQLAAMSNKAEKKRYFVVYGVYSDPINAGRVVIDISERTKGQGISPRVHTRGHNYMVTAFETDRYSESTAFVRKNKSAFPDMWVLDTTK